MRDILVAGGYMLLCALGSLGTSFIAATVSAKIAANLSARLRLKLFDKVQSFSWKRLIIFQRLA